MANIDKCIVNPETGAVYFFCHGGIIVEQRESERGRLIKSVMVLDPASYEDIAYELSLSCVPHEVSKRDESGIREIIISAYGTFIDSVGIVI